MAGHTTQGEVATMDRQHVIDGVLFGKTWQSTTYATGLISPPAPNRNDPYVITAARSLPNTVGKHPRGGAAFNAISQYHTTNNVAYHGREHRLDLLQDCLSGGYTPGPGAPAKHSSGYPNHLRVSSWVYTPTNFDFTNTCKYGWGLAGMRNFATGVYGGTSAWAGGGTNRDNGWSWRFVPATTGSPATVVWKTYEYAYNRQNSTGNGASDILKKPDGSNLTMAYGQWIWLELAIWIGTAGQRDGRWEVRALRPYAGDTVPYLAASRTGVEYGVPTTGAADQSPSAWLHVPITGIWGCFFLGGTQKTPRDGEPNPGDTGTRFSYSTDIIVDDAAITPSTTSSIFDGNGGGSTGGGDTGGEPDPDPTVDPILDSRPPRSGRPVVSRGVAAGRPSSGGGRSSV